jgi:hypothetical protein
MRKYRLDESNEIKKQRLSDEAQAKIDEEAAVDRMITRNIKQFGP